MQYSTVVEDYFISLQENDPWFILIENPSYVFFFQLEAANRKIKELEEQVSLEMQARDEVEHNYK